ICSYKSVAISIIVVACPAAPDCSLSLPDALPSSPVQPGPHAGGEEPEGAERGERALRAGRGPQGVHGLAQPLERPDAGDRGGRRSEEHTSELQSRENLVCRLLLQTKNHIQNKET